MIRFSCILLGFVYLMVTIQSCKPTIESKADLHAYIGNTDNGLCDTIKQSEIVAKIKWQPWQLISNKLGPNKGKEDSNSYMFSKNMYFVLSLSKDGKEVLRQLPFEKYSEMVQVFSFRMADFISASSVEGISIPPVESLFQQTYGMTDSNMLLVVFEKEDLKDCKDLMITIKEFGLGIGDLKFRLDAGKTEMIEGLDYRKIL